MNKNHLRLLCGALALLLTGCASSPDAQVMDATVQVEVAQVQQDTLSTSSTYIGTISAEGTANVVAMVSGMVESVAVSAGDTVSAGDLLCSFDDESAQISLKNAQASYHSAQSSYENAQTGYASAQTGYRSAQESYHSAQESYNSAAANYGGEDLTLLTEQIRIAQENYDAAHALYEAGGMSRVEVDQALQALNSAEASLESARASLNSAQSGVQSAQIGVESAQVNMESAQVGIASAQAGMESAQVGVESAEHQLSLYHLTAPVSGVVEAVNVIANNFTSSGTVAFVISNAQNKTVTFYVTDEVRQNLSAGQLVTISARNLTYQGTVSEISGVVDASTGLFQVKALVDSAQDLPDGLSVSVTTVSSVAQDAMIVPSDALYFDGGVAYIYLVRDGKAVRTEVNTALYTRESTAVTEGLNTGDTIITSWSSTLKDGAAVRIAGQNEEVTE